MVDDRPQLKNMIDTRLVRLRLSITTPLMEEWMDKDGSIDLHMVPPNLQVTVAELLAKAQDETEVILKLVQGCHRGTLNELRPLLTKDAPWNQ